MNRILLFPQLIRRVKDKNIIFRRLVCLNFGSKFLARYAEKLLGAAHIASDLTSVFCAVAGTIFGTTDIYIATSKLLFGTVIYIEIGRFLVML